MDALSEALRAVHMTGAIFFDAELSAPWGVSVPEVHKVAPILAPGTEQIVNFHLVLDGEMLVESDDGSNVRLSGGDIVIMPSGAAHRLSNGTPEVFHKSSHALRRFLSGQLRRLRLGGGGQSTKIICGFFGCDRHAADMILAGLPPMIRIPVRDDPSGRWLEGSIRHLVSDEGSAGRSIMLSKMAEALFIESMRRYMQMLPPDHAGWLAGARDPAVGRALAALHGDPHRNWTASELAQVAGASRTVLSDRFRRILGTTPMAYLARWRMHLAERLLRTTHANVLQVALEVGYESEAAFNRAFRREFGTPPAQYRRGLKEG